MSKNLQVIVFLLVVGAALFYLVSREANRAGIVPSDSFDTAPRVMPPPSIQTGLAPPAESDGEPAILRESLNLLARWNAAHNAHDVEALRPLYASEVNFYGRRYGRDEVLRRKLQQLQAATDFAQESNTPTVASNTDGARVEFDKTWIANGHPGSIRGVLELRWYGSMLLISTETDASVPKR